MIFQRLLTSEDGVTVVNITDELIPHLTDLGTLIERLYRLGVGRK